MANTNEILEPLSNEQLATINGGAGFTKVSLATKLTPVSGGIIRFPGGCPCTSGGLRDVFTNPLINPVMNLGAGMLR